MKRPQLLIFGAWVVHAIAWFLPAVTGVWGGAIGPTISGWEAFCMASGAVFSRDDHLFRLFQTWYSRPLYAISVFSTVLFVVGSPWLLLRRGHRFRRASAWLALIAFFANTHWYILARGDRAISNLGIGYFLWWLSFAMLAIGFFLLAGRGDCTTMKAACVPR